MLIVHRAAIRGGSALLSFDASRVLGCVTHEPSGTAKISEMLPSCLRNEIFSVDSLYSSLNSNNCASFSAVCAKTRATSSVKLFNTSRASVFLPKVLPVAGGLRVSNGNTPPLAEIDNGCGRAPSWLVSKSLRRIRRRRYRFAGLCAALAIAH